MECQNLPKSIERIDSHTGAVREIVDMDHTFYKKSKEEDDKGFHYHTDHDELMVAPGYGMSESVSMERKDSLHEHTGVREERNFDRYAKSMPNLDASCTELALLPGEPLNLPPPIERLNSHTGAIREFSRCSDTSSKSTDLMPLSLNELNFPKPIERISSHTGVKKEIFRKHEIFNPVEGAQEEVHGANVGEWSLKPGTKKRVQAQVILREKAGKLLKGTELEEVSDVYIPRKITEPAEQGWYEVSHKAGFKKPVEPAEEWVEVKKGFKETTTPKKNSPPLTSSGRIKTTSPRNLFGSSSFQGEPLLH